MFEDPILINKDDLYLTDDDTNVEPYFDNLTIKNASTIAVSPTYENDPNGGVIVTDIFGGKYHYMDMEQAQTLTDFFSGLPIQTMDTMPSHDSSPSEESLPTDIHTPNDLTFYDDKIEEAQRCLDKAIEDAARTTDTRELEDALERQSRQEMTLNIGADVVHKLITIRQ